MTLKHGLCLLLIAMTLGLSCGAEEAVEVPELDTSVTFCVQYANISSNNVAFEAVDANGDILAGSQATLQGVTDFPLASEVFTLTGPAGPITFRDRGNTFSSCTYSFVATAGFVQLVEAKDDLTLSCAQQQSTACNIGG